MANVVNSVFAYSLWRALDHHALTGAKGHDLLGMFHSQEHTLGAAFGDVRALATNVIQEISQQLSEGKNALVRYA